MIYQNVKDLDLMEWPDSPRQTYQFNLVTSKHSFLGERGCLIFTTFSTKVFAIKSFNEDRG